MNFLSETCNQDLRMKYMLRFTEHLDFFFRDGAARYDVYCTKLSPLQNMTYFFSSRKSGLNFHKKRYDRGPFLEN
jgi:hypothetical protein